MNSKLIQWIERCADRLLWAILATLSWIWGRVIGWSPVLLALLIAAILLGCML